MVVLEIKQKSPKSRLKSIKFDNGERISLYSKEVYRFGIKEGEELRDESFQDICEKVLLPRAKKRCLHLLEKQDRTRKNLLDKLRETGYPADICEAAVEYAESFHYVDDRRYAGNYIRYHQNEKSRRRLIQDLTAKGISRDIIEEVMDEELTVSPDDQIRQLITKRHYNRDTADEKEKARMMRYLAGRGFSYSDFSDYL